MKLSKDDSNLIQRLRRREKYWFSYRWVMLLGALLMFAGSAFLFQRIWSTVDPDQILILLCILVAPLSGVLLFVSLAAVVYAFVFWDGRPTDKLLLRLADEGAGEGLQCRQIE